MIKRFIKNREFERNALILFVSLMVANLSNYVFQIIMARFLSVDQFGVANALFSFLMVTALPIPVLILVVTKYIAESMVLGKGYVSATFRVFLKYSVLFAVVFGFLLSLAVIPISTYLRITNYLYIILMIITIALSYIWVSFYGFFQGIKDFNTLSILYILPALGKLLLGIILLYFGYKILGVMVTMIVTAVLPIIFGFKFSKNITVYNKKEKFSLDKKELIRYLFFASAISVSNGLLSSLDLLFIKHYFSSYDTGLYSSAAILGKMMLYIPIALTGVMFPTIVIANKLGQKIFKTFIKTLLYSVLLIIIAIFLLNSFSEFLIDFLFGSQYAEATKYVFPISIASGLLGILSVIIAFLLAINMTKFLSLILFVGTILYILLVIQVNDSILSILYILQSIISMIITIGLIYLYKIYGVLRKANLSVL